MDAEPSLHDHLSAYVDGSPLRHSVAGVIGILATVCGDIADIVALGRLSGDHGRASGTNAGGDSQKALDVTANDLLRAALRASDVAAFASEESEGVETLNPTGSLCLAIDPIDGSGNIDLNMPLGTIFSILPMLPVGSASDGGGPVWPAGSSQVAAGFVVYGPQTSLVLTLGTTVDLFTLDRRAGVFRLTHPGLQVPATSTDYAINASNYRHWEEPVRTYVDECLAGVDGPFGRDFNMRWHGALVAEVYRILLRGGVYLYPADSRQGYREGRLRLVYEAYPMALLLECAGGSASDGRRRILDLVSQTLHEHVPLILGSRPMVEHIERLHHRPGLWPETTAPLFANRGLFRS